MSNHKESKASTFEEDALDILQTRRKEVGSTVIKISYGKPVQLSDIAAVDCIVMVLKTAAGLRTELHATEEALKQERFNLGTTQADLKLCKAQLDQNDRRLKELSEALNDARKAIRVAEAHFKRLASVEGADPMMTVMANLMNGMGENRRHGSAEVKFEDAAYLSLLPPHIDLDAHIPF